MNYKIKHTYVGPYPRGSVVSEKHFTNLGEGVDFDRLINLGAVEETDDEVNLTSQPTGPELIGKPAVEATGESESDYDNMSQASLRALCKERDIKVPSVANKPKLIALLKEDDANSPDEGGVEEVTE